MNELSIIINECNLDNLDETFKMKIYSFYGHVLTKLNYLNESKEIIQFIYEYYKNKYGEDHHQTISYKEQLNKLQDTKKILKLEEL